MTQAQTAEPVLSPKEQKLFEALRVLVIGEDGAQFRTEISDFPEALAKRGVVARFNIWSFESRGRTRLYSFEFALVGDSESVTCSPVNCLRYEVPQAWDDAVELIRSLIVSKLVALASQVLATIAKVSKAPAL